MPASIATSLLLVGLIASAPPEGGNEDYMRAAYQSAKAEERLLAICGSARSEGEQERVRTKLQLIDSRLGQMFGADKVRTWRAEAISGISREQCSSSFKGTDSVRELGSTVEELLQELEI